MEKLTPAQIYALNIINAIDKMALDDVRKMITERPQTLRSALRAYLYASINQRNQRNKKLY